MKKAIVIIFNLLIVFLIFSSLSFSQLVVLDKDPEDKETSSSEIGQDPVTETDIPIYSFPSLDFDDIWAQYRNLIVNGQYDEAVAEISRMVDLKNEREIQRLTFYAFNLSADAYILNRKLGKKELAHELFEVAQKLDPKLPDAFFIPFYIELKGGFGVFSYVMDFVKGVSAFFTNPYNKVVALSVVLSVLLKSLVFTGVLFVIILVFKYGENLRFDVEESAPFGKVQSLRKFAGLFFLLLPLALGLGFEYIILYLLVVLLPYATNSQKIAALLLFLGLFFYTPWLILNTGILATLNDEDAKFEILADESFYADTMAKKVTEQRRVRKNERWLEDVQVKTLMAYGKYREAYNAYRIMRNKYPGIVDIPINMGNIRFLLGRYDIAKIHYEEALALRPNNIEALYNFKLVVEQLEPFRDTTDLKNQIQALNQEFADQMLSSTGQAKEPIWVDHPQYSKSERIDKLVTEKIKETNNEKSSITELFVNPLSIAAIVALFASFIINAAWRKRGLAMTCQKCNRKYRPKGLSGGMEDKYCQQCVMILFKKEGVAPDVQRKKILEINDARKKDKAIRTLLSILIPGSRHIYVDKGFSGFLIMWKWVLLILIVFTGAAYNIYPFRVIDLSFGPFKILALILLLQTQLTSAISGIMKNAKGE